MSYAKVIVIFCGINIFCKICQNSSLLFFLKTRLRNIIISGRILFFQSFYHVYFIYCKTEGHPRGGGELARVMHSHNLGQPYRHCVNTAPHIIYIYLWHIIYRCATGNLGQPCQPGPYLSMAHDFYWCNGAPWVIV
jgi:hypothetical protein